MISGAIEHGRFSMACLGLSGPFPAPVRTPLDKVHGGPAFSASTSILRFEG
jgi:hypothetical protein